MAYLPSAQSSPYANMQYVNTAPDLAGFANVLGNVAQTFEKTRQANADRSMEMYRIQSDSNRQIADNMLNYMKEIRANRLQESQQAMDMLRLSTEMKELNYRMEQTRKLDDAKWQARDARAQLFPLLSQVEGRVQDNDLWGASTLIKQAFSIPGVTDDETSIKLLSEYNTRLNSFKIDDRPALQVLNSLRSEVTSNFGSASWDKFRDAMKRVSTGSNFDEVSKQLVSEMGAPIGQSAKIKSFLERSNRIATPEQQARLEQFEQGLTDSFLQTLASRQGDPTFDVETARQQMLETREMGRQMLMHGDYSIFRSSENPTTDPQTINNLVQPIRQNTDNVMKAFETLRTNAATRAAYLGGNNISDPEVREKLQKENPEAYRAFQQLLSQRNPKIADKILQGKAAPSELRKWFTSEEGIIRKYKADLDTATSNLMGVMARMDSNPSAITENDMLDLMNYSNKLDDLLAPYYGPGSISMDFINKYATPSVARSINKNRAMMARAMALTPGGGGTMGGVTIPSTPAPQTAIPFETK